MSHFVYDEHRIHYEVHGDGPNTTVLLPGLLITSRMQHPLARSLARRGHRVITMDPLGHGASDRPADMWRYSMAQFAEEVVGLLDHLEVEQAVVGGTSLGANVTLEVAARAPERLRGMVVEMPVLDNALLACAFAFSPLLFALTFGEPAMRVLARAANLVPRKRVPFLAGIGLDWIGQDPKPSGAVLQGLFFGEIAPHRTVRRTFTAPTLIIGHPRDPVHPFSDADMLAHELPNARLVDASSILELRLSPKRLTGVIGEFVDECWETPVPARARRRAAGA